ncbi:MAG TPA: chemotaxis protein CheW [Desulfuromonadales bacterium]|nr:chemotaxis protein CheW [Desulfuromonadales bacterium]
MMDLAEIRKKAKTRPKSGGQASIAETKSSPRAVVSIQGAPAEQGSPPPVMPLSAIQPLPGHEDPLEALFNFRPDVALASEESYLQTLRGQDEQKAEVLCEWLTFRLGSEEYALDIAGVSEIIKLREITDIPRVPEFILGIISLRGIIVPIFDLKKRLKLGVSELTPASRIIVCQWGERSAGLLVDSISQVVRIPAGGVESPPAVLSGVDRELLNGVGRIQGRMLILLDLANVLNAELN